MCEIMNIKVDTKTVTTKDGPKQYHFAVIGNPCLSPEGLSETWQDPMSGTKTSLQEQVPDLKCSGDTLTGATLSDHGHIIIGMFHENGTPAHATRQVVLKDEHDFKR